MYRLLGTAVIFTFMCMGRNWQYIDHFLNEVSKTIVVVDYFNTVTGACSQYKDNPVKEDFNNGNYRYEVSLPEFSGNFTVNIKYRAMLILAHEPRLKQCDLTYYTVTTLPEYVDTSRAVWSFEYGTLTVLMPGKKLLDEAHDFARFGCYYEFSEDNIIVPRTTLRPATSE